MRNIIERVLYSDIWYCAAIWVLVYAGSVIAHFVFMPAGLSVAFHLFWLVCYAVGPAVSLTAVYQLAKRVSLTNS